MLRALAVLGVGYVLGTKAGRERYEQIAATARAVTQSPATKAMIDAGRRKIAEKVSPDPKIIELTEIEIDDETVVIDPVLETPQAPARSRAPPAKPSADVIWTKPSSNSWAGSGAWRITVTPGWSSTPAMVSPATTAWAAPTPIAVSTTVRRGWLSASTMPPSGISTTAAENQPAA